MVKRCAPCIHNSSIPALKVADMGNFSDRDDRSFRQLHDLRGRTFVEADYAFGNLTACFGCSRMFAVNERHAVGRGFVTSVRNGEKKRVYWICPQCFRSYRDQLRFVTRPELTLQDVLDGPPLGPPLR